MLAVVILNYNGLEYTTKCLFSLSKQTQKDFLTIVVDNASSQDPSEIPKKYRDIIFLRRDINGGYAGGNNTGINYALEKGCESVVLLNNDTLVAENFVERIQMALDAHRDFGILGPMIYSMKEPDKILTEGVLFNRPEYNGFFEVQNLAVKISEPPNIEKTDIVNGCCLAARKEIFDSIGLIDEQFFIICEESDFCIRAAEHGFKCGIITESLVWHKQGATFTSGYDYDLKSYYNARNLWLLLNKRSGRGSLSKGRFASRLQYLRTIYYMCCTGLENGVENTTIAVIDGVADALSGKFGRISKKRNIVVKFLVQIGFKFIYRVSIILKNFKRQLK